VYFSFGIDRESVSVATVRDAKRDCRSDSLCFCAVDTPSHVSSELI
jgi:hypothetical protein